MTSRSKFTCIYFNKSNPNRYSKRNALHEEMIRNEFRENSWTKQ